MTWYNELKKQCEEDGENFHELICYPKVETLWEELNTKENAPSGKPFTAWGKNWIYFPLVYGGIEFIGKAPRNPCNIAMEHQGLF
jgi:hypothetical protein